MKLSEMIQALSNIQAEAGDLDPVVVIADWSEDYKLPSEWPGDRVSLCKIEHKANGKSGRSKALVVLIGENLT